MNRIKEFLVTEEHSDLIKRKVLIQRNQFDISQERKNIFFNSDIWKSVRRYILKNYENECSYCKSKDSLQIDHIRPLSTNPSRALKLVNLQILCVDCNKLKSNLTRKRYGMTKKCFWKPFNQKNISKMWMDFFPKK